MSFNHLSYDTCTYAKNLKENVSILGYILSPMRYENKGKCRHELGLVGGTSVSHIQGNLVDLESDMRGITRYNTKCVDTQWHPINSGESIKNDKTPPIDTTRLHLKGCQTISYRSVPIPQGINNGGCSH